MNNYVLTIKAENRPGLIHLITGTIEKKRFEIKSLSAAPTDIHDIILVTVELFITESQVASLALKLENIIEVFSVQASKHNEIVCLRAALFKMAKTFLETPAISILQKYGADIVNFNTDSVMVAKYGSDIAIRNLYNELEGPHLLGFSQTGLISESPLIGDEIGRVNKNEVDTAQTEERIIRLAA